VKEKFAMDENKRSKPVDAQCKDEAAGTGRNQYSFLKSKLTLKDSESELFQKLLFTDFELNELPPSKTRTALQPHTDRTEKHANEAKKPTNYLDFNKVEISRDVQNINLTELRHAIKEQIQVRRAERNDNSFRRSQSQRDGPAEQKHHDIIPNQTPESTPAPIEPRDEINSPQKQKYCKAELPSERHKYYDKEEVTMLPRGCGFCQLGNILRNSRIVSVFSTSAK
jgi:hypothetical protein